MIEAYLPKDQPFIPNSLSRLVRISEMKADLSILLLVLICEENQLFSDKVR